MSRKLLKTFDNAISAHIIQSRLENEGITTYIYDENIVTLNPLYTNAVGGIKLMVNVADFEKASEFISEIDGAPLVDENNQTLTCPKCRSTDFYTNYKSMKGVKGFLSAIVSFMLFVFPIYFKVVYKCKKCGFEIEKR